MDKKERPHHQPLNAQRYHLRVLVCDSTMAAPFRIAVAPPAGAAVSSGKVVHFVRHGQGLFGVGPWGSKACVWGAAGGGGVEGERPCWLVPPLAGSCAPQSAVHKSAVHNALCALHAVGPVVVACPCL